MKNHDLYYQALRDKPMYPTIAYGSADEIWKPIKECYDLYEISNLGRVRSIARATLHSDGKTTRHKSRILKQRLNKKGYLTVRITAKREKMNFIVHRLVAMYFLNNPDALPEVNHKNEIKTDNRVSNLEWCTTAYNVDYSQAKTVTLISPQGLIITIRNIAKFQRENGLTHISDVVSGKRKHNKGWKLYVD